jgi:topoisomerase-4 subunit B
MTIYDSASISVLKGLDPVKKRPGMYTDTCNPNHLAQEVIDNSIDEATSGFATYVRVTLKSDGFIEVKDDGRGIPVSIHPTEGRSGAEVILDTLHSGGKFDQGSYRFSGGLHGVGISVVNALSDTLVLEVKRDGKLHKITYHNGEREAPISVVDGEPFSKDETGTTIRFLPNPIYFDSPNVNEAALTKLLHGKAILCPGLNIIFQIESKNIEHKFYYTSGIQTFLDQQDNISDAVAGVQFVGLGVRDDREMEINWGCYFTEHVSGLREAYVNLIPTIQGGTHTNAFRQGLFEGMREYAEHHGLIPKHIKLTPDDTWKNANYVISLKMMEPSFAGQTKERLSSQGCASFISTQIKDSFSLYLNKNTEAASGLFSLILSNAMRRVKESKKIVRKELDKVMPMPGKLNDCDTESRDDAELFLVEGDSAGGSANQARDRETQAIMPLRGKILNTWEVDSDKVMESNEVNDISTAIGVDPGSDDISGLRYGKICILADADSDGLHIATLILALMMMHFRPLVEHGHVYVSMPPLFRIDAGKKVFYALDEQEREHILAKIQREKIRGEVSIQRFKGLGEMNPSQLRETTLNPVTRRLVQVTIGDLERDIGIFDKLLKKKNASARQDWLSSSGDNFEL